MRRFGGAAGAVDAKLRKHRIAGRNVVHARGAAVIPVVPNAKRVMRSMHRWNQEADEGKAGMHMVRCGHDPTPNALTKAASGVPRIWHSRTWVRKSEDDGAEKRSNALFAVNEDTTPLQLLQQTLSTNEESGPKQSAAECCVDSDFSSRSWCCTVHCNIQHANVTCVCYVIRTTVTTCCTSCARSCGPTAALRV